MKKLNLKGSYKEMLSKTKMKQIIGGGDCKAFCRGSEPAYVACSGMFCASFDYNTSHDGYCVDITNGEETLRYCSQDA